MDEWIALPEELIIHRSSFSTRMDRFMLLFGQNLANSLCPTFGQTGWDDCLTLEQMGRNMNAVKKQMKTPLQVLHLEDNSCDAELIKLELEKSDLPCSISQICTQKEFEAALQRGGFDIVVSDSQLPGFDTLTALARTREVCPTVPFIFVSGTSSPTIKANAFFRGAVDFIQKDELPKLVSLLNHLFRWNNSGEKIPVPEMGIPVLVQCKEFRCLGYLDRRGKWRDFARSHELPEVIHWSNF
jgi:CheY-like chemotaxis protein